MPLISLVQSDNRNAYSQNTLFSLKGRFTIMSGPSYKNRK